MEKQKKLMDILCRMNEEIETMTEQYVVLEKALMSKIDLVKENAEQAEKDVNRQQKVGWTQFFFGMCAVVGGLVACIGGLPVVGAIITAGGIAIAGT